MLRFLNGRVPRALLLAAAIGVTSHALNANAETVGIAGAWVASDGAHQGLVLALDADGRADVLSGDAGSRPASWTFDNGVLSLRSLTSREAARKYEVQELEPERLRLGGGGKLAGNYVRRDAAVGRVSGSVTYMQRIALAPNAKVTVRLLRTREGETAGEEIAARVIPTGGKQVPIPFHLHFLTSDFESGDDYAVSASIAAGAKLLFRTPSPQPVLTKGRPTKMHVVVRPVARKERKAAARDEVTGFLAMYAYMADAGLLRACDSNERLPVATEGANALLERAYLENSALKTAPEMLVRVDASIVERPKIDGEGKERVWYIEDFIAVYPTRACPSADKPSG